MPKILASVTQHGVNGYSYGCRCDVCRLNWNSYIQQRRRRLKTGRRVTASTRHRAARYYEGKTETRIVRLTPLATTLLERAAALKRVSLDDIFEALARNCGKHVTFGDGGV